MNILSPSILASDFTRLGEQIKIVENAGAQYLHFDVMDGVFVPNISIGPPVLESVRKITDLTLDVHLMITKPEKYIETFAEAGADIINFHLEAAKNPRTLIRMIRELGKLPAMTVKPDTDIKEVFEYINQLHMVLIMSVEPGFGGQSFMRDSLKKAERLRAYADENNIDLNIEMDGGIYLDNVAQVIAHGVNVVVAGSSIFHADDIAGAVKSFFHTMGK